MIDIDAQLAHLRDMPLPLGLETLDAAVLAQVTASASRSRPLSGSVLGAAALVALTIGVAGSVLPGQPLSTSEVAPFGAPALAPSSLLSLEG